MKNNYTAETHKPSADLERLEFAHKFTTDRKSPIMIHVHRYPLHAAHV